MLPITNYDKLLNFAERCGACICQRMHETFQAIRDDPAMTMKQGVEYAVEQCEDLLRRGALGIHFYCLNQVEPVRTVRKRPAATQGSRPHMLTRHSHR